MMQPADLPKCECGAQVNLSFHDGRHWCPDCLWAEIKGLRLVLERAKSVANFWKRNDATISGVPARIWNLQRAIEAAEVAGKE